MKKGIKSLAIFSSLLFATSFTVVACGPSTPAYVLDFDFAPELSSRRTTIFMGETPSIILNPIDDSQREYEFESDNPAYVTVDDEGVITPVAVTPGNETVGISIYEVKSDIYKTIYVQVREKSSLAHGGYNYASDTEKRTEILGELESFAMKNFLTGISLFENGGYMRFSPRFTRGAEEYVTGYGFGTLTEGKPVEGQDSWLDSSIVKWRDYYRSASSSDPADINAWMATGSQVASLNGYISSSFYGTKLHPTDPTKYVWYPVLADCEEPIAIAKDGTILTEEQSKTGSYKTWRIYVKEGNADNGVVYHTSDNASGALKAKYDGRAVTLDDYEFAFKMLLTGGTKLKRGTELATDTSYGFKGAYSYWRKTSNYTGSADDYEKIESAWNEFKNNAKTGGGIRTSKDIEGAGYTGKPYIQFEFINPLDQFNAKYNLSSNLYSPLPEEFLTEIGGSKGWINGATVFGRFQGEYIDDYVLCVGPYHLEEWNKLTETVFKRNDDWFEYKSQGRYKIPGVHIKIYKDATQSADALYNHFMRHELDSTSIPSTKTPEGTDKLTRGDSTFKLNVNSCTQDRWNELFGTNGSLEVAPVTPAYTVNPLMSNYNFLKGLWWSINRKEFAEKRGTTASYNYFADAYLSDPTGTSDNASYNSTEAHKKALKAFGVDLNSSDKNITQYGFSEDMAKAFFRAAVSELSASGAIKKGSASSPTVYTLRIEWMNPTDESEYGEDIERYFKNTFNDKSVCGGTVKLEVSHHNEQQWNQVYEEHLMKGKFDLGFGAISGNSLNPLNFMEVLRSDNSSGFTLNWGTSTSKVDPANPIIYDGKEWTYDSLWAAGDHGSVVYEGREEDIVQTGYISNVTKLDGTGVVDNFENMGGGIIRIPFTFVDGGEGASFDIERIQLYLVGAGSLEIDEANIKYLDKNGAELAKDDKGKVIDFSQLAQIEITISAEFAATVNKQIYDGNRSLQKQYEDLSDADKHDQEKVDAIKKKFRVSNYYSEKSTGQSWWAIEVYYNVNIEGSDSTQSSYDVKATKEEQKSAGRSAARLFR